MKLVRIPAPMRALTVFIREGIEDSSNWIDPPVGQHVFSGNIPKKFIDSHKPLNCVTLKKIPTPEDMSPSPCSWIRVDTCSYGENFEVAEDIDLAVYSLLKSLQSAAILFDDDKQEIFIWAAIPNGSMQLRDPELDWPYYLRSYRIRVGELNQLECE